MMAALEKAFAVEIRARIVNGAPPDGVVVRAEDIDEGVVLRRDGITVTAFAVDHPPIKHALGYRVDYGGHSVVLSGDTRVSENLIRHAKGTDVLIHEVASPETFRRAGIREDRALAHHVTPEEAGTVFAKVRPKLAVYSHVVQPIATEKDLIGPTRKTYGGPVEVGEDLMVIVVGDKVEVHQPEGSGR